MTLIQMIDESEQIIMDNATFIEISSNKVNKDNREKQWSKLQEPDQQHRYLQLPLYTANKLKKGLTSQDNPVGELPNYFTIMDLAYVTHLQTKPCRIPSQYRHMGTHFGEMVKLCLNLQRQGELTQDMMDTLIDTVEIFSPLERLIMVVSDLETYRNLQLLNDLLSKGHSMAEEPKDGDYDEAVAMVDDILKTDYQALMHTEERLNPHRLGILSRLKTVYFDPFLKQELEIKEEYKVEYEETKAKFLSATEKIETMQDKRIE